MKKYTLNGTQPIEESDLIKWANWFETSDKARIVAKTTVGGAEVSTAFLGLDRSYGEGHSLLFETMIFGGDRDGEQWLYGTWKEAEIGHERVVRELT